MTTTLQPHPRLYAGPEHLERLTRVPRHPLLAQVRQALLDAVDDYVASPEFEWKLNTHNAHLLRARRMQSRVLSLLVAWRMTKEERYRRAAVEHVLAMGAWEYWSSITWREGNADPLAIFDLSYGENSATLAIAWDWLADTLAAAPRQAFVDLARRRSLRPFLAHTGRQEPAFWFGRADSNWNSVCAGGAGMLALAMHEELPEARRALPRVERSFRPFMAELRATDGGWTEGLGYWNYGMRYAFMYLLSHQRATGRRHPLLRQAATRQTLSFPLDLAPHGIACGFGDANSWKPMPFHYAAAMELGCLELVPRLDALLEARGVRDDGWPDRAEMLLFHPRQRVRAPRSRRPVCKLYRGMDWGVLADRLPDPRIYASIRGGTTEVPHGHRDLLSFWGVVNDEALVENLGIGPYLDTTFGPRRYELFETMPASKNTLLVNGVGVTGGATVPARPIDVDRHAGIRLDATEAMGAMRDGPVCRFCARLFLLLGQSLLIVDRIELTQYGRPEARFHTRADIQRRVTAANLKGARQRAALAFAADVPAALFEGVVTPTGAQPGARVLRWCTQDLHRDVTLATLLTPGGRAPRLQLTSGDRRIEIAAAVGGRSIGRVVLTTRLRPAPSGSKPG
ncbi:MAG: heparinase II/III family protein [Gemmatimonadota bacterium]